MRTHYQTLGIPENADQATIRRAYRRQMRYTHPDFIAGERARLRAAGDEAGLARLAGHNPDEAAQALNAAYAVLSDPDQRRAYDRQLAEARRQPAPVPAPPSDYRPQRYDPNPPKRRRHEKPPPTAMTDLDPLTRRVLYAFLLGFALMALLSFIALAGASG